MYKQLNGCTRFSDALAFPDPLGLIVFDPCSVSSAANRVQIRDVNAVKQRSLFIFDFATPEESLQDALSMKEP